MKIAIVTDSTASLSKSVKEDQDLRVIQVPVIIDGVPQYNVPADIFYQRLSEAKNFPTTSQPSIGETLELYQSLVDEGYTHVIAIHITSGISGYIQTVQSLVNEVKDLHIIPFDSGITSLPMGIMVETALSLVHQGKTSEEIIEALNKMRAVQEIYLVVDDLHHLVRGGRLSNGTAMLGSLLKIKPILKFDENGNIVLYKKVRTAKKSYHETIELIKEDLSFYKTQHFQPILGIAHAGYKDKAQELAQELSKQTGLEVRVADLGTVIGAHTGAKTIGMGIMLNVLEGDEL